MAGIRVDDGTNEIIEVPGAGVVIGHGPTVPSDGAAGWAHGAVFVHTDGTTGIDAVYLNTSTMASCAFRPLYAFAQGAALTAQSTTITHEAPGTPDYAIAALTDTGGFGFASADEGLTVLSVIANLQARLAEVEARLEAAGLIASN